MQKLKPVKFIRAGFFGLVIIFFFLPFVLISCPGRSGGSVTLKGIDFVTGKVISGRAFSAFTDDQRVKPQPLAIIAIVCAAAGIVFSFLKEKPAFVLCLAAGAVGLTCMILLQGRINAEAYAYRAEGLRVYFQSGYWTAIAGFALALLATIVLNPFMKNKIQIKRIFTRRRRR
jgi:Na+/H+-translocating membrane pyrophosphatase